MNMWGKTDQISWSLQMAEKILFFLACQKLFAGCRDLEACEDLDLKE